MTTTTAVQYQPWSGSGTATTVAARVDVRGPNGEVAGWISFQNTGGSNALLISFDGTHYLTVNTNCAFSINDVQVDAVYFKSASSTTTYEWVAAYGVEE